MSAERDKTTPCSSWINDGFPVKFAYSPREMPDFGDDFPAVHTIHKAEIVKVDGLGWHESATTPSIRLCASLLAQTIPTISVHNIEV